MERIPIKLNVLEKETPMRNFYSHGAVREFHIDRDIRREFGLKGDLFALTGNVILADIRQTRELTAQFNAKQETSKEQYVRAGHLYAMGLIDEILHYVVSLYRQQVQPDILLPVL